MRKSVGVCLGITLLTFGSLDVLAGEQTFPAPITEVELAQVAGRENVHQYGSVGQDSVVSSNTIIGDPVTGTIQFDGQAFQNMNGLAVINANTGNNVSFNASMLVNIVVGSAP